MTNHRMPFDERSFQCLWYSTLISSEYEKVLVTADLSVDVGGGGEVAQVGAAVPVTQGSTTRCGCGADTLG